MARIWPDVTEDEVGFVALAGAVERVRAAGGDPLIIDSDDLCRAPEAIVAAWCDAVGLDPDASALAWEPGMRPEWERWRDWYGASARSSGFAPPRTGAPPRVEDPRLRDLIAGSRPIYEALRAGRVRPR
jgi:hypothetical protein